MTYLPWTLPHKDSINYASGDVNNTNRCWLFGARRVSWHISAVPLVPGPNIIGSGCQKSCLVGSGQIVMFRWPLAALTKTLSHITVRPKLAEKLRPPPSLSQAQRRRGWKRRRPGPNPCVDPTWKLQCGSFLGIVIDCPQKELHRSLYRHSLKEPGLRGGRLGQ